MTKIRPYNMVAHNFNHTIWLKTPNPSWTKIGDLATGRNGHAAIISGSQIMIVGGDTDDPNQWPAVTEVWDLEKNFGHVINPSLPRTNYSWGVALFLVDDDFCKK